MKRSSCRELKKKILGKVYHIAEEMPGLRSYRVRKAHAARARRVRMEEVVPIAAIGVAPWKEKDYKLAIRIFWGQERRASGLLQDLKRYEREIDLVMGVRYKPRLTLRAGGSCGHYKITAGTLGGFVEDGEYYYILSNNHVLANSNFCFGDDPILQPGPADINPGRRFDVIARLHRWYPLSKAGTSSVDAAIARFSDDIDAFYPWDYAGIGRIQRRVVAGRYGTTRVIKRGRTTGVTRGRVSAYELDGITIDYGTSADPAIVTFDDQIEMVGDPPSQPFSAPGDSGSLIIDRDTMEPYALLYAGGRDSQGIDRTLAHFLPSVLHALNVQLVQ